MYLQTNCPLLLPIWFSVSDIINKNKPFVPAFDPGSPFADENGMIGVPNVNLAEEAVNLTIAEVNFKASARKNKNHPTHLWVKVK